MVKSANRKLTVLRKITFLLSVVLFGVTSLSWGESGVSDKEVLIGGCLPLSGSNALGGTRIYEGSALYSEYINSQGGIHGRKIRVIAGDDKFEPVTAALDCWNGLMQKEIFAYSNSFGSAPTSRYVRLAQAAKVPAVGFSAGPKLVYTPTKRYVFPVRTSFLAEASGLVEYLIATRKLTKFAAIYPEDLGGIALLEGVIATLTKYDLGFTSSGSMPRAPTNVDAQIETMRQSNPEAVFVLATAPVASLVLKSARRLGWQTPVFANIAARDSLALVAGEAAEGVIISQVVPPPDRTDLPLIALYNRLLKEKAKDKEANYYGLEGFLNLAVVAEGLKRAGKHLSREAFVDALESIHDFDIGLGPNLKLKYSKDYHAGLPSAYLTLVRNGRVVSLE